MPGSTEQGHSALPALSPRKLCALIERSRVQVWLSVSSSATLGQLFYLSVPQFPLQQNGENRITTSTAWL